jgi:hypothetical protein
MTLSTSFKCSPIARLLGSRTRKSASQLARATRTPLPDRVQVFPGERENVDQEGFNALVHRASPPYRLSA